MNNKCFFKMSAVTVCAALLVSFASCGADADIQPQTTNPQAAVNEKYEGASVIELSTDTALLNGAEVEEYDYTW